MKIHSLSTPLTKEMLKNLSCGDIVELSGTIYTARDAAHERLAQEINHHQASSIDLKGQILFYAGPTPTKPGHVIGSIAPTTAARMDAYVEMTLRDLGILAMIGKGNRAATVADLCRQYGAVYFLGIGGASALIAQQVTACEVVAYDELGTESIKKLTVEKMQLIVGIDASGHVFQDMEIPKYQDKRL